MNKTRLLKIWYLVAFGLTGLFTGIVCCVGLYMSVQPREETQATAHQVNTNEHRCYYYFTYGAEGQEWATKPKSYYSSRAGCPLTDGEVETIYYDPENPLDFSRSSPTFGLVVAIIFGLITLCFPAAIRKKWNELDGRTKV